MADSMIGKINQRLHNRKRGNRKADRVGIFLIIVIMSNSKSGSKSSSATKPSVTKNPNYPSTTGNPSGKDRGNVSKSKK